MNSKVEFIFMSVFWYELWFIFYLKDFVGLEICYVQVEFFLFPTILLRNFFLFCFRNTKYIFKYFGGGLTNLQGIQSVYSKQYWLNSNEIINMVVIWILSK